MNNSIKLSYRKDLDEMRIFDRNTKKTVVYIQGYSRKYPVPVSDEVPIELLVLMAVQYPEIKSAM